MDLSKAIMAIYDMAYSGRDWSGALGCLLKSLQARNLVLYDTGDRRAIRYERHSADPDLSRRPKLFAEYNALIRPMGAQSFDAEGAVAIHQRPAFSTILDSEMWTLDAAHRSRPEIRFTRERLGLYRRCFVNLSEDPLSFVGLVALYAADRPGAPPASDLRALESVTLHLGKAMEIHRTLHALRARYRAVLSVLDMMDLPLCLVAEDGQVLIANRRARALFEARDGVWMDRQGRIACREDTSHDALRAAIRDTALTAWGEGAHRSRELIIARRGTPLPVYAIASPLRDADLELEPGLTGTLLTLIDGAQPIAANVGLVAAAYGLTGAETAVAHLLIPGHSNAEIAARLGVGPETVKSQVSALLMKTQCRNRLAFVWRVFQFSPPVL